MRDHYTPLRAEDSDQVVPPTSRKIYVAVDENGVRIGETHGNAKLSDKQVDEIRDLREAGGPGSRYRDLAEKFAVPKETIAKICQYQRRATAIAGWKVILLHTPTAVSLTTTKED